MGNGRFVRDLSGGELLVWRVPSLSCGVTTFISCCPWIKFVAIGVLVVLDDVVERIPVVGDLDVALVGSKVITTVADRLIGVVVSELNCQGGASEKGKIEELHLK